MLRKLMAGGAVVGLMAGLWAAPSRADDKMASKDKMAKPSATMASKTAKGATKGAAAKCMLVPTTCAHCKAPMKAVNGTTMKCTKCGMTAAAMCSACKAKLVNGKCPKCGMTMAQLKKAAEESKMGGKKTSAATCPHCKVKMVNGKCPMCGMTMKDMGKM